MGVGCGGGDASAAMLVGGGYASKEDQAKELKKAEEEGIEGYKFSSAYFDYLMGNLPDTKRKVCFSVRSYIDVKPPVQTNYFARTRFTQRTERSYAESHL